MNGASSSCCEATSRTHRISSAEPVNDSSVRQRRVKNLEVAFESWTLLLAQYEYAQEHGPERARPGRTIQIS